MDTQHPTSDDVLGTYEDLLEALDAAARHYLGISGEEFRRRWDAGEYAEDPNPDVMNVAILLPAAA